MAVRKYWSYTRRAYKNYCLDCFIGNNFNKLLYCQRDTRLMNKAYVNFSLINVILVMSYISYIIRKPQEMAEKVEGFVLKYNSRKKSLSYNKMCILASYKAATIALEI